jgi:hypothetical protein
MIEKGCCGGGNISSRKHAHVDTQVPDTKKMTNGALGSFLDKRMPHVRAFAGHNEADQQEHFMSKGA